MAVDLEQQEALRNRKGQPFMLLRRRPNHFRVPWNILREDRALHIADCSLAHLNWRIPLPCTASLCGDAPLALLLPGRFPQTLSHRLCPTRHGGMLSKAPRQLRRTVRPRRCCCNNQHLVGLTAATKWRLERHLPRLVRRLRAIPSDLAVGLLGVPQSRAAVF